MVTTPYIIGITATKLDGTAYVGTIWLVNERTNETQSEVTNSEGKVIFDCANFQSEYVNGDNLTYSMEAYAKPAYYLIRKNPFEDTSVDDIEFNGERLNTATMTVNIKII